MKILWLEDYFYKSKAIKSHIHHNWVLSIPRSYKRLCATVTQTHQQIDRVMSSTECDYWPVTTGVARVTYFCTLVVMHCLRFVICIPQFCRSPGLPADPDSLGSSQIKAFMDSDVKWPLAWSCKFFCSFFCWVTMSTFLVRQFRQSRHILLELFLPHITRNAITDL